MKELRNLYVVYDIRDDNTRNNLSDLLMEYGLHRIQYSVFSGIIPVKHKEEMIKRIREMEIGEKDKIHILDLCERCFRNVIIIGKKDASREHIVL